MVDLKRRDISLDKACTFEPFRVETLGQGHCGFSKLSESCITSISSINSYQRLKTLGLVKTNVMSPNSMILLVAKGSVAHQVHH